MLCGKIVVNAIWNIMEHIRKMREDPRGQILGKNPDKSLKSFLPCYSQSPLELCLDISISSNSRNLLQFLQFRYCTLYRRKEGKLIENHTPFPKA